MTAEELEERRLAYEAKLGKNRTMRRELDEDDTIIIFSDPIHSTIKTLGDIIFNAVIRREPTYYDTGLNQTPQGKRRTIEDTYKIQRSYNIKAKFREVKQAFDELESNNLLSKVFCKRTLVRTYSKFDLQTTQQDINNFLTERELNYGIKEPKIKKLQTNKRISRLSKKS